MRPLRKVEKSVAVTWTLAFATGAPALLSRVPPIEPCGTTASSTEVVAPDVTVIRSAELKLVLPWLNWVRPPGRLNWTR